MTQKRTECFKIALAYPRRFDIVKGNIKPVNTKSKIQRPYPQVEGKSPEGKKLLEE